MYRVYTGFGVVTGSLGFIVPTFVLKGVRHL